MSDGQLDLLGWTAPLPNIHFSGRTYNVAFDCERLNSQQRRVHDLMQDGAWRTLRQIASVTEDPEASISARLRDFNNNDYLKQFFRMERMRSPGIESLGVWIYRVLHRQ